MNISYKWLKEYVDFDLTPQQTADALTSCGLEVDALEEVQTVKGGLKGLYVGKVLTCEMHPNSDHLHVTTVDLGKGDAHIGSSDMTTAVMIFFIVLIFFCKYIFLLCYPACG